jgi:hypothetical protein
MVQWFKEGDVPQEIAYSTSMGNQTQIKGLEIFLKRAENPGVRGSNPRPGSSKIKGLVIFGLAPFLLASMS